jgi:hypothetical protein
MRDLAEKKYGKVPSGDTKPNSWTLLDFGEFLNDNPSGFFLYEINSTKKQTKKKNEFHG